ncbi:hypothetical protein R69927_04810 [Paraburkholderia domus]|jgi:hypothetical protein|nr:hypothetical protein R70006_01406 [Paraburkholderia domus]CAE6759337.1 hypothetical protein R75483_03488 [Paraburkholderia domus]CAE6832567.1 hypothetical protein R69749_04074 [Paraburkholderia domus]CAE6875927.1 hypothetical protein R75471_01403 [Paraburkholderia domus]CAE6890900.1 hypothetical protein R69927_04810 [Paraburkholderia domus]
MRSSTLLRTVTRSNESTLKDELMDVQHVADAVLQMAELPLSANVQLMTIMASKMPFVGRG